MSSILPLLCAGVLLGAPGYLMLCSLGVRLRLRWGWAPVVTVLMSVTLATILHLLGIPWHLLTVVVGHLILVLAVGAARLAVSRRPPPPARHLRRTGSPRAEAARAVLSRAELSPAEASRTGSSGAEGSAHARVPDRDDVLDLTPGAAPGRSRSVWAFPTSAAVTGVAIASGALLVASATRRMGGISTLNGSFDSFFHLSAAAFIRERGDAFLTTALTDIYGEPTFYPVVFDTLVALLPFDVITSANAMMLAMLAAVPAAVGAMVAAVARPSRSGPLLVSVSAATTTLFLSTAAMALVMGLWPIVLGVVCLPIAIAAVLMLMGHRQGGAPGPWRVTGLVLIVIGTALAHPSVLFSVAVVAGLRVLMGGIERVRSGHRGRGWLEIGAALVAAFLFVLVSGVVLSGMHLTKPSADGLGAVIREILLDSPRIPAVPALLWPMAVLWILAVAGAVAAFRRREVVGETAVVTAVASVVLGIATQIDHPLAVALVNPWYGARERIAPLMMCMLVLLMARGLLVVIEAGARRRRTLPSALAVGAVVVTVLVSFVAPQRLPLLGSLAYTAYGVQLTPYVPPAERAFIERTAEDLPRESVVLADPLDGATLYWSVGGVETVYPTMSRPLTRETTLIAHYANRAGTPEAFAELCRALDDVGPTHVYRDLSEDSGQRINPEVAERWRGVHDIPESRLTLVEEDGPYALYELDTTC